MFILVYLEVCVLVCRVLLYDLLFVYMLNVCAKIYVLFVFKYGTIFRCLHLHGRVFNCMSHICTILLYCMSEVHSCMILFCSKSNFVCHTCICIFMVVFLGLTHLYDFHFVAYEVHVYKLVFCFHLLV